MIELFPLRNEALYLAVNRHIRYARYS